MYIWQATLEYLISILVAGSYLVTLTRELGGYLHRQLVITGTKETLELKPLEYGGESTCHTDVHCSNAVKWAEKWTDTVSEPFDRYEEMMVSFAKMVAGKLENPYPYDYELMLFKTILEYCGRVIIPRLPAVQSGWAWRSPAPSPR